jgi:minor extracellular serine protease Vpr
MLRRVANFSAGLSLAGILTIILVHSPASAQIIPNRYILILEDPPVSAKFSMREDLQSAEASVYRLQIENKQAAIKKDLASRSITVTGSVSVLQNVIFVATPASRAGTIVDELKSIPGVVAVRPMRRFKPSLNRATQLMNAPAAWTTVGGIANAGLGIRIGILDTGIDQTHPAFQDSSLPMPAGFPKCTTGHPEDCAYTSNKVIVARSYVRLLSAGSNPSNPAVDDLPDDYSPRDRQGHGTGVASTAAGVPVSGPAVSETGGSFTIQGMAPKAYLGNYKIAGSPGVAEGATDQTLIQAVEDAVADGMDVISTSFGSPALSDAASDPLAAAFEAAAKTGAVVTVAAGNANENGFQYPAFNTISSPSNAPDVISVGATENSHVLLPSVSVNASGASSNLKGIPAQPSDTFNYPSSNGATSGVLVDVTQLGDDGTACNSLPAYSLDGVFALLKQGSCDFITQTTNAENAGAIGIVFYMADSSPTVSPEGLDPCDAFFVGPAVMISNASGVALKSYVDANPGQSVTIDAAGTEVDLSAWSQSVGISPAVAANMLAGYSSTGPTPDGQLKPDLVATGGNDLGLFPDPNDTFLPAPSGMYMATQSYDPNQLYGGAGSLYSANGYWAANGTSFATPLVAGAAALVKQAHAGKSLRGTQIKSLLVNSTSQGVVLTDDFGDPVDVQWMGAGLLNAGAAVTAAITAEPSTVSFGILAAGSLPIARSITLTNIGSSSATLTASVSCCTVNGVSSTLSGTQVTLGNSSIVLAAGASSTLTVTLKGTIPTASEYSGSISLQQGSAAVAVIPFLFLVGDGVPFNVNVIGAGGEGAPGTDNGPMVLQVVDQYGVPVKNSPVSFTVSPAGSVTVKSYSGEPACTPASSTTTVTCDTDQFGFAYADVVLGSTPSSTATVNFNASGTKGSGGFNIQAPPAVTGVADAAAGLTQIVPGSYAAIYGTGLSNTSDSNGAVISSFTPVTTAASDPLVANGYVLPLQIDYVTVSFDVPSAGISVAGHPTYVSPGQVNVQVPWELQGQSSVQVKVSIDGDLLGNVFTVPVVAASPAFFTNSGTVADALDTSYNLIGTSNPAKPGQTIFLYANGLGPVSNQPASGNPAGSSPFSNTPLPVVTIGGQKASVSFSGLTPSLPGLYQINVVVPSNISAGVQNITVAIGSVTSPVATLPIQ